MTSQNYFKQLYSMSPLSKREIDLVICHVLKINTAGLFIYSKEISEQQQAQVSEYITHREKGKPLAYIIGYKGFWTLKLKVNKHTLIPRPETEQIVELVLNWTDENYSGKILDLGTGTGAIALSIAKERPQAQVTAVDYSQDCVEIAEHNKIQNDIQNVTIIKSDWFENIKDKFDYIVSNPPYIAEDDEHLIDLKYEPITALTAKNKGLADIEHIIINAKEHLNSGGYLVFEHGYNQCQDIQKLFAKNNYTQIETFKDLADIPRITKASL